MKGVRDGAGRGKQGREVSKSSVLKGGGRSPDVITYLVILNILRSRRARKTLIPKDVPGLNIAQTTSKMLPTVTYQINTATVRRRREKTGASWYLVHCYQLSLGSGEIEKLSPQTVLTLIK